MKQDAQIKMMMGIGAGVVAIAAAGFGIKAFLDQKDTAPTKSITVAAAAAETTADYSAAVNAVAENAGSGTSLNAEEAKRIGEEVARQVAEQVARSVVAQSLSGAAPAATGGEGLTEADARRIGAEEGRRVAQEVTAMMLQNAAATGSGGMTAAEAEQIGMAAGRRAAEQVAANTAREVVRSEFGGSVAAKSQAAEAAPVARSKPAKPKTEAKQAPSPDALKPWWISPGDGEFGLVTANQLKAQRGIALLFSDAPGDGALQDSIRVYNIKGVLVSGKWTRGSNQRLVQLSGLKPGRYTVVIDRSFASKRGKVISKAIHGPVYVQ